MTRPGWPVPARPRRLRHTGTMDKLSALPMAGSSKASPMAPRPHGVPSRGRRAAGWPTAAIGPLPVQLVDQPHRSPHEDLFELPKPLRVPNAPLYTTCMATCR